MKVLAVDVGGNHVKILAQGAKEPRRFDSGPTLTPEMMVNGVLEQSKGWEYDAIAIGYPGPVREGKPAIEPHNLGAGWVGFDYAKAFGRPVRVTNDAAMQALGSYQGNGRMLFLGLGTGLGSAMVIHGELAPMELAHLPYRKERTYEDYLGDRGLQRVGLEKWQHHVEAVVELFRAALEPDDIVLGGGNVHKFETLPARVRRGDNDNAFTGGFRLWAGEIASLRSH